MQSPTTQTKNQANNYAGIFCFLLFSGWIFFEYYCYYPLFLKFFISPSFTVANFFHSVYPIGVALRDILLFILLSFPAGKLFLKVIGYGRENKDFYFLANCCGFILVSIYLLGLSLIGLFYPVIIIGNLFMVLYFSWTQISFKQHLGELPVEKKRISWGHRLLRIYIFLLLLFSFCVALTPTTESDALRYHVSLPSQILQQHGFYYYSYNSFFQFPAVMEMQYAFGMMFHETVGPKVIHWIYFLMTALLLGTIVKTFFKKVNPIWVVAIFVSTPFVPIISGWAFVETALTFYTLLSVYLVLRIRQGEEDRSILILLGLVLGTLLGIKYSMVVIIPIYFIILWVVMGKKSPERNSLKLRLLIISVVVLCLSAAPWFIKNYLYTGNPVYPLGYSVFGGEDWSPENAKFYMFHAQTKGGLSEAQKEGIIYRGMELFYLPVKASLNPPSFQIREAREDSVLYRATENRMFLPDNFGDWQLGPLYLIFLPLFIFFVWKKYRERRFSFSSPYLPILIFILWNFLIWSQSYRDNRFLLPILPLLAIWIGGCLAEYKSKLIQLVVVIVLIYNGLWVTQTVLSNHNPFRYILRQVNTEEYLSQKLNYYPAFKKLQQRDYNQAPVLLIGEYRSLYLDEPNYTNDYFDTPVIVKVVRGANELNEVYGRLREMGVKYVLYNENEMSLYAGDFARHFKTPQEVELFRELMNDLSSKMVEKIPIERSVSEMEVNQIRQLLNDPTRDPRNIYIYKLK